MRRPRSTAAVILFALAAAACGDDPRPAGANDDPRIAEVLDRLAALERRVAEIAVQPPPPSALPERVPASADTAELERRIAALEHAQSGERPRPAAEHRARDAALQAAIDSAVADAARETGRSTEDLARRAIVAAAKTKILDATAPEAAKVEAHGALRQVPDAYTDAMVQELVRIGFASSDGQLRADVWRFFDGATKPPGIVGPLLRAIATDTAAVAREEAAETLGNYRDQPGVDDALRFAAEHDGDERVRAKARRTLGLRGYEALGRPRDR